ncbi:MULTISPECIES: CsbD family protein [unclassified Stenotrophomonas]|uniref:CsbD family protein n=1 Tax=unclassified Stenotrophomonas TaxID=196198 RepID=UPI0025E4BBF8|nr:MULTISPECIES: CsbD family protein [unclassified Stenotrophomonas]
MNKDIISGKWTQLKGKVQAKWGDITDDDMKVAEGNAEYLAGRLQERYGWAKDRAESEVRDFQKSLHDEYPDYR